MRAINVCRVSTPVSPATALFNGPDPAGQVVNIPLQFLANFYEPDLVALIPVIELMGRLLLRAMQAVGLDFNPLPA